MTTISIVFRVGGWRWWNFEAIVLLLFFFWWFFCRLVVSHSNHHGSIWSTHTCGFFWRETFIGEWHFANGAQIWQKEDRFGKFWWNQVSISSMFFGHVFRTRVIFSSYILAKRHFCTKKHAQKKLMKFTQGDMGSISSTLYSFYTRRSQKHKRHWWLNLYILRFRDLWHKSWT